MAERSGSTFVGRALKAAGVDTLFFLPGGPITGSVAAAQREGIRVVDVHHEQAAAMAAHAYARVTGKPGVCIAAAGPATTNLVTGIYNAYDDRAPVVAIGGAAPLSTWGRGDFQEVDQVAVMRPVTRWADRVLDIRRIPEVLATAFREAVGRRGPVYVDLPGDVLYSRADDEQVRMPTPSEFRVDSRPQGDPRDVERAIQVLSEARQPVLVAGSGVWWSQAYAELREFVEVAGIPCFTTPLARGLVAEDHPLAFPSARGMAFREADVVMVVGTRFNFIIGYGRPPRFRPDARFIQVDIDPEQLGRGRPVEAPILGDARAVLRQLTEAARDGLKADYSAWVEGLREEHHRKQVALERQLDSDRVPIHPLRLFKEVRDVLPRERVLVVDGHVTLLLSRQVIPIYEPGTHLNEGTTGCIGVGVPFGVGAQAGRPDRPVVVLSGDGGFGMNGMELETAVRHNLPVVVVVNNNGGWAEAIEGKTLVGRDLPFLRYDRLAQEMGAHGEHVERPEDIRPALERALASGRPACVNVVTDPYAKPPTANMPGYESSAL